METSFGDQGRESPEIPCDRVPDRVDWQYPEQALVHRYWNHWRKWRADFAKKHGWIKQRGTKGRAEWGRLREMIHAIETTPIQEMLDDPARYYRCKKLRPPPEGRYAMRYNNDIRLVFILVLEPIDDQIEELVAEITDFGYHYDGIG